MTAPTDTSPTTRSVPRPPGRTPQARRDASGMDVIPLDECVFLLRASKVGRLAFVDPFGVVVLPVNHYVDGFDIYFRTAPGSKLSAARRASSAAFEVDGFDDLTRGGWSVVAVGTVNEATEIEVEHLRGAPLVPWADGVARDHWLVLRVHRVTGRRIHRQAEPKVPVQRRPGHAAAVERDGASARLECSCGWHSRPVSSEDAVEWVKAREEYHEHLMLAGAEAGPASPADDGPAEDLDEEVEA